MKKSALILIMFIGTFLLSSNGPVNAQASLNDLLDPPQCTLEYVKAWVVDNIPNYTGEAYFASEETAGIFIDLFGGGDIVRIDCMPYDEVIRTISDPCTPCD